MEEFNEIDDLILTKSFNDLTSEELIAIKDLVSNEAEFLQLKMAYRETSKMMQEEMYISPNPETKTALMDEFRKARPAVGVSRTGGLGILFPKSKPFYSRPGIQILAVAASILLLFTVVDFSPKPTSEVAMEDSQTKEEGIKTTSTTQELTSQDKEEVLEKDNSSEVETSVISNNQNEINNSEKYKSNSEISDATNEVNSNDKLSSTSTISNPSDDEVDLAVSSDLDMNYGTDGNDFDEIGTTLEESEESEAMMDTEVLSEGIAAVPAPVSNNSVSRVSTVSKDLAMSDMVQVEKFSKNKKRDGAESLVIESQSLEADQELIDLFYTAM